MGLLQVEEGTAANQEQEGQDGNQCANSLVALGLFRILRQFSSGLLGLFTGSLLGGINNVGPLLLGSQGDDTLFGGNQHRVVGDLSHLLEGSDLIVGSPGGFHQSLVLVTDALRQTVDGIDGGHGSLVGSLGTVDGHVKVLTVDEGIIVLAVDRANHGQLFVHIAHIVHKVCAVEHDGVHGAGGVPHEVGMDLDTVDGNVGSVVVGIFTVVAAAGDVLVGLVVAGIEFFLQNGGIVAAEDHGVQVVASVEGLVTDGGSGVGHGDHLHIAARKGVGGDSDGILCHLHVHRIDACVGDQFQTVGHLAVQGAVNDGNGGADLIIIIVDGILGAVEVVDGHLGEGFQIAQCEGVVAQGLQVLTQSDGEGSQLLLQEDLIIDDLGTGKIDIRDGGVGEAVGTNVLQSGGIFHSGQALTVGKGTLTHRDGHFTQLHSGDPVTVYEGIVTNGFRNGQVQLLQGIALHEGVVANGLDLGQVDDLQSLTAGKGIHGDLGDTVIQHGLGHVPAVSEGILTDGSGAAQIDLFNGGSMVGIDVLAFGADSGISHAVVHADVVNVAGEGIVADGRDLAQVDFLQAGVVVEGLLADLGIFTQGDGFQAGGIEECALTNDGIVADGQFLQSGGEGVVEELLLLQLLVGILHALDLGGAFTLLGHILSGSMDILIGNGHGTGYLDLFGVAFHSVGIVHTDIEGVVADGDIIADGHGFQAQTFAEHALFNNHVVGDHNGLHIGESKGILADAGIRGEGRQFGQSGLEEGILTDVLHSTQGNGGQVLGGTEGIIANLCDLGQFHRGDLGVVGEGAAGDGGDLGIADIGSGEAIPDHGRDNHQRLAVGRQNVVGSLNLVVLVAGSDLKGGNLGIPEGELADVVDVGADGHALQLVALVEHTLGDHGRVDIEGLQGFTAGEGVGTVLDLGGFDGHIGQALTAGEGILADGQQGIGGDDAFQILVAGKGVVRNDADSAQINGILQVTVFEGVLVDDLQIVLTAEGDLLQGAAAIERTVLDGIHGGRQHDLFQSGQVCKGIGTDLFNTLGDDDLGDGVVTDVPLLTGFGIVECQLLRGLLNVVKVCEGEVADLGDPQILREDNQAAVAVVVAQGCAAVGNKGILDFHGNGFGIVGASAILQDLDGNGGEALGYGNHVAVVIDGYNVFVAGFEFHRGVTGEEGIQGVVQQHGFGGVHAQAVVAAEETDITGIADLLLFAAQHEVGLLGGIAVQTEHIGNRLVITAVALVTLGKDGNREGQAFVGLGVTDLDDGLTGGGRHQFVVHHTDHAGSGGGELQQFGPLGRGEYQGIQGVDLIGAQGDALLGCGLHFHRLGLLGGNLFLGFPGGSLFLSCFSIGSFLGLFGSGHLVSGCLGDLSLGFSFGNSLLHSSLRLGSGFLGEGLLYQLFHVEISEIRRQTHFVGSIVQGIVIAGDDEGLVIQGIFLDVVQIICQFKGNVGGAVLLGVNGGHVLLEGSQHGSLVAILIGTHGNEAQLRGHGVVVIVNGSLGKQLILVVGLVVLGIELHVRQGGSLKVDGQGEAPGIVQVGVPGTVPVVHPALQGNGVLGIVGQVEVHGIEFDFDIGRVDVTAVAVGLTDIGILGFEDHFASGVIGDGDLNAPGGPEHAGPDKAQGMNGSHLVGQSDIVFVGGDDHIGGILQEVVGTQVADVVTVQAAHGTGGVGIGLGLVFFGNTHVQLIGIGIEEGQVKHGRNGPVTVVGQVRNIQVNVGTLGGLQGDVAFHIHAIGEGSIQVSLVRIAEGDGQLHIGFGTGFHLQGVALQRAALHLGDINDGTFQNVGFLVDGGLTGIGLGFADTLGHNEGADFVGQVLITDVIDGEGHFVNTGTLYIIAQLQLGLVHGLAVGGIGGDVSGGVDGIHQVGQARALFPDGVGLTVGAQRDIRGGHQQLVHHGVYRNVVTCDVGEVLHHILPQQDDHTGQVGAGHGSAGQTVVAAAGNGGQNVAAVAGDLRLDIQAGSGAPGGEVGNEGTGGLGLGNLDLAAAGGSQHFTVVLGDGADSQLGIAHVHLDLTGYIIIYDDTGRTLGFGDQSLFFKGVVTAANQSDLTGNLHAGVVGTSAHAGDYNIFHFHGILVTQQVLHKVPFFGGTVVGLIVVDDGVTVHQVRRLHTVDGSDGENTLVGTGGTHRTGVGIGGQTQVTVGLGAVGGGVAVGGSHHNADTGCPNFVINAVQQFFLRFPIEAAGSTQGHVDHVHAQNNAVFQSRQDPGSPGGIHHVGEDLHGNQLCVGGNTGDHIVLTHDHTGHVGAVVVVGGVNVGIVVGIVIAVGHLFVDVDIIHTQAAVLLVGSGLAHHRSHVLVGQAQVIGGEVIHGEGGMIGVQARIQNRDYHAAAVVAAVSALEDTGLVHADRVLHQLGFHGPVAFAHGSLGTLGQGLAGCGIVGSLDHQLKAADQGVILFAHLVSNGLFVQNCQNVSLFPGNLLPDFGGLPAMENEIGKAYRLVGFFVGIHQGCHIHRNDHGNLLILADVVGQLEGYIFVQIILVVHSRIDLLDVGCVIGGSFASGCLCRHYRYSAQKHCHSHQQGNSIARYLHQGILVHIKIAFLW